MKISGVVSGFAFALLMTLPAWSADVVAPDLCAVSGVNGKLAFEGGAWDANGFNNEELIQGVGSLSMPLGCMFGLQLDAGAGEFGDANSVGVGGHLFMRDPNSYLFGVHATYEDWSFDAPALDVTSWKVGAEGELYLGNISLEAWAGVEDTNRTSTDFFGKFTAAIYATDDLRLSAGIRHASDFTSGVIGAEWQVPDTPLSFTAEGQLGEDDFRSVAIGAKFYFGGTQKSLIDRHRQDDPEDGLFDFLGSAASVGCQPVNSSGSDDEVLSALADGIITDGVVSSTCGAPPQMLPEQ